MWCLRALGILYNCRYAAIMSANVTKWNPVLSPLYVEYYMRVQ